MSRAPVVTPEIAEQVRARRRSGCSYATICREFGISKGSVGVALSGTLPGGKPPAGAPVAKGRPPRPQPPPRPPADAEELAPDDGDLVALLRRQVRALEELAVLARGDKASFARRLLIVVALERLLSEHPNAGVELIADTINEALPAETNVDAYTKIARVLNTTTALLSKIIPPVPPDPEAAPDRLANAHRAREKLRDLVARVTA